jgi:hypothetical protein
MTEMIMALMTASQGLTLYPKAESIIFVTVAKSIATTRKIVLHQTTKC